MRRATDLPLLVKLSPNVADIRPIARAIADAGADALTAINTLSGIAVSPSRDRPLLGNVFGGLSGPAVKPVALRIVYEAAQAVSIPIVAIGGVTELADVLDFLAVGRGGGPGRHGDLRRPDAAGPARGRARSGVPSPRSRNAPGPGRERTATQGRRAVGQGRRVPALSARPAGSIPRRLAA